MSPLHRLRQLEVAVPDRRSLAPAGLAIVLAALAVVVTLDVESTSAPLARSLAWAAVAMLALAVSMGAERAAAFVGLLGIGAGVAVAGGADEVAIVHLAVVGVCWFLAVDGAVTSIELRSVGAIPGPLIWPFVGTRLLVAVGAIALASVSGLIADWAPPCSGVTAAGGAAVVVLLLVLFTRRTAPRRS